MAAQATKFVQGLAGSAPRLLAKSKGETPIAELTPTEIIQHPSVQKFWSNAKVEMAFPGPSEWPQVANGFSKVVKSAKTGAFANLTVKEAAKNTLVFIEVASLFYVGEIIGRGSIIGYDP